MGEDKILNLIQLWDMFKLKSDQCDDHKAGAFVSILRSHEGWLFPAPESSCEPGRRCISSII
jgi:hypothetical protein